MKIEKAIEILGDSCWDYIPEEETDIRDAVKLGIEALKFCQKYKRMICQHQETLLPGEDRRDAVRTKSSGIDELMRPLPLRATGWTQ